MKKFKYLYIIILSFAIHSCDYLDIVPDNVATIEYSFRNRTQAEKFLYTCYSYRPAVGHLHTDPGIIGAGETCQRYSSQGVWPNFRPAQIARGYQNANSPVLNFWDGDNDAGIKSLWVGIRDCNIFLENIDLVGDLTDYEKKRWVAEVKFLKAYYHYFLMKHYGPIPIVDENLPISAGVEGVKVSREPIDKVVKYITDLMEEAANELPNASQVIEGTEAGRVYDLVALAIRAEVFVMWASPLFNNNVDFASMLDKDNNPLFPQGVTDVNKWSIAAEACKKAIDACHTQGKELYDLVDPLVISQPEDIKLETTLRQAICDRWNKELIWGATNYDCGLISKYAAPRLVRFDPNNINNICSEWAPTLQIVERFYSSNGVPIEEDATWLNNAWYENRYKVREEPSSGDEIYRIRKDEKTVYLHYNREPRFYSSIGFDKGIYFGSGYNNFTTNVKHCDFLNFQVSGFQAGSGYSATGYAAKKMHSFKNSQAETQVSTEFYPFPIIRLADLYLLYAEALNEANLTGVPSDEIFEYLDKIRYRAGLEGVRESWEKYSTNKDKPKTPEGLREIIRQERAIELAFEGKRYWDMKRWKQIDILNSPPRGWTVIGETSEDFYVPADVPMYTAKFTIKDYFCPIKESNLFVNENLIQNYGW